MTLDLLSIESLTEELSADALIYLQNAIPEHHRMGVGSFVKAQRKVFDDHAGHLAAVLKAIASAPKEYRLGFFEEKFIEWLRENGVSSSRITQLKGAIRIKMRVLVRDSSYSETEKEIVRQLEVEKAYLFGRLTFEGQREVFTLHNQNGSITLKQLRQLTKEHTYDPKTSWQEKSNWVPSSSESCKASTPKLSKASLLPMSQKAYDLTLTLQSIVDDLLDIKPQWEGDQRILSLVDAKRLDMLASEMCQNDYSGGDF